MFRLGLGLEILDLAWLWAALSTLLVPSHDSPLVSLDTLGPEKRYVILLHDMSSTDSRFLSPPVFPRRAHSQQQPPATGDADQISNDFV